MKRQCAIPGCERTIYWRSDGLCHNCYKKYVNQDGSYPDWVKFLVLDEQKVVRDKMRSTKYDSQYGLLEDLADIDED